MGSSGNNNFNIGSAVKQVAGDAMRTARSAANTMIRKGSKMLIEKAAEGVGMTSAEITFPIALIVIDVVLLIIVLLLLLFLFWICGACFDLDNSVKDGLVQEGYTAEEAELLSDTVVNDAERFRQLIVDGKVSFDDFNMGAWDSDDFIKVLDAVIEVEEEHTKEVTIAYESQMWEKLENDSSAAELDVSQEYVEGDIVSTPYGCFMYVGIKENEVTYSRRWIEPAAGTLDAVGGDVYQLRWQPIVVCCMMRSMQESGHWGYGESYYDINELANASGSEVSEFYLTEEMINECIACFDFEYNYYFNPLERRDTVYTYEEAGEYVYNFYDERVDVRGAMLSPGSYAYVTRLPVIAPKKIYSPYITYNYTVNYETAIIESRSVSYTPYAFQAQLEEACGGTFNESMFLYLLAQLPGTEDLVETYSYIFDLKDTYEADVDITPMIQYEDSRVPSLGAQFGITSAGDSNIVIDPSLMDGDFYVYVDDSAYGDKYTGYYYFDDECLRDILIQEEWERMSISQIRELLRKYFGGSVVDDDGCAEGLYYAQEEYGISVCALLGIMRQEGSYNTHHGRDHYNYFSFTASESDITNGNYYTTQKKDGSLRYWCDMGLKYENEFNAQSRISTLEGYCIYQTCGRIYRTYYVNRTQTNFYYFCWWKGNAPIEPYSTITRETCGYCYCPFFDDPGWVERIDSDGRIVWEGGWTGRVAGFRATFENQLQSGAFGT